MTVQQPWAGAIADGWKLVENRSRDVWVAGEQLAIHAGRRWSDRGAHDERVVDATLLTAGLDAWQVEQVRGELIERGLPRGDELFPTGAVVAVVAHLGSHRDDGTCCRPWGESAYAEGAGRIRTEVVHVQVGNVQRLPNPVPCPGQLGRWSLPADVEAAVRDQLATVDA